MKQNRIHLIVFLFLSIISSLNHLACASIAAKINSTERSVRYEADYEIPIKVGTGKAFIAYIIEEGDLFIKKRCKCILRSECAFNNSIELSK